jgi:hypothetical protein
VKILAFIGKNIPFFLTHNREVAGSSPAPATRKTPVNTGVFLVKPVGVIPRMWTSVAIGVANELPCKHWVLQNW